MRSRNLLEQRYHYTNHKYQAVKKSKHSCRINFFCGRHYKPHKYQVIREFKHSCFLSILPDECNIVRSRIYKTRTLRTWNYFSPRVSNCLKKSYVGIQTRRENSDDAHIRIRTESDTFAYSRGCLANERVAKRSATRWSMREGWGGIGPYHGDSSCTTRSEGFSRRRLPRGWKWGLKRFRWETQQGVNGSRHAGGARNVSLEARRKRAGQRKREREGGEEIGGETTSAHIYAHTRVACCYAWTRTHVRARIVRPRSPPPHHRYTTTAVIPPRRECAGSLFTKVGFTSFFRLRIPRRDATRHPFALLFSQRRERLPWYFLWKYASVLTRARGKSMSTRL